MNRVFAVVPSLKPLGEHSLCCVRGYEWAGLSKGVYLIAVEPRTPAVREHLAAVGAKLLPGAANPRALTAAEAGLFPAAFSVSQSDTAFSALRKVYQALGHAGLDPEL